MSAYLRPSWILRLSTLLLVWGVLSGFSGALLRAEVESGVAQPASQEATPTPPAPVDRSLTAPEAAWAAWEALSPDLQAKVDGRILSELRGNVLPAHLGGAALSLLPPGGFTLAPQQRTRFIVHLRAVADLSAVDERVYASQADRRSALVETLRATAESNQAGVLGILNARSASRQGAAPPVAGYQPFFIVNAIAVEADLATIIELARQGEVSKIVANYPLYPVAQEPEDPGVDSRTADGVQAEDGHLYHWNLQKVQVDRVHSELGIRGAGAVVGGFDTGVSYRHPALIRQYRGNENGVYNHNYNWFVPDGELYPNGNLGPSVTNQPTDCSDHGTHTMGTMVGDAGGNAPTIGMAPDARWIALPGICGATMPGGIRDDIGGIKAFQWFLCPTDLTGDLSSADCSKAPDVVNSSWGSANPVNDTFRPILQVLRAAGVAPVFAAGNPSAGLGSIGAPANAPEAITVGATDEYDSITYFSALGPSVYPGEQKPELSAPGDYVLSSVGSSEYMRASGTSMAAPHVSGLIALLVSADLQDGVRDFDVEDMERLMTLSAVDLGEPGADNYYGYGRIDAYAAVQLGLTAGDLSGQIFDKEYNTPVPHIRVEAYHPATNRRFTVQADASGLYSLTVPAGDYQVTLSGWGYETTSVGTHKVVGGALSLLNFSLLSMPKAVISGVVRNENGPVANALIYPAGNPALQSRSGANGRYQILLPLGPDELIVVAPNHRILRRSMQTPGVGVEVNLALKSAPSILLVDTSSLGGWFLGWPVYRFFTRALDEQNYQYDLWRIQSSAFSDTQPGADGSTRYGLPSAATLKTYDLVIWVQSTCNDAECYANSTADIGADPAIVEYLDSGGRLFISGQNMGVADGQSILYDEYLQADLYTSDGGYTGDIVTGADFLSAFRMPLTNGSLYGYANGYLYLSPDAVVPQPDGLAFPVLRYPYGDAAAALAVAPCDASYRALYLAAGYENLTPRAHQSQPDWTRLLDASITWLTADARDDRYSFSAGLQFGSGQAGDKAVYPFSIANLSNQPMRFAIDLRGNSWPTTILRRDTPLTSPLELPACSRSAFDVVVDLPYSAQLGERDAVTLTVVSTSHPGLPTYQRRFETLQMPQWAEAEPLPSNRGGMSTLGLDNSFHIIGGWDPFYGPTADHQRFDPCKATWESRSPLPEPSSYAASAAIGDRFFVAGGIHADALFIYDSNTDTWSQGAPMPRPLYGASGAAAGGKFYVFGGYDGLDISTSFLAYDPATNQWQDMGVMDGGPRLGAASAVVAGEIYLLDGAFNPGFFTRYTPATNLWQQLPSPTYGRYGASLVAAPDGYLYLLGGQSNLVERYHPATLTWSSVNYTLDANREQSGAVYVEGKLYLVGGFYPTISHESLRLTGSFCESAFIDPQTALEAGGEIVYTLDVRSGDRTYPNARLAAPLHPGQSFAGFGENSIGASYNPSTHAVEWSGTLPANAAPLRLAYAAPLKEGVWRPGDRITHTVHLDNGSTLSMTRSAVAQIFAPDFSASTKAVSQQASPVGTPFTYTIDLRSYSPVGGAVSFTDPLPPALDYVAGSLAVGGGTGSYDPATHTVQWQGAVGVDRPGFVNLDTGYAWVDTLGEGKTPAPEFVWQDIRSTGQPVISGIYAIACDLPVGFAFPFFGDEYTKACVDVSGYISFGDFGYPDISNICPLPRGSFNLPRIAGVWGQLAVDDAVYTQTFGAAPRRYTIFQWTDAHFWDFWDDYLGIQRPPDTDFQIVLHEDGRVQVHMLRLGATALNRSTTGLASPYAGQSVTYQCNRSNTKLRDKMAVEFLPPGGALPALGQQVSFQTMAQESTPINSLITNTVTIRNGQETYTRTATLLVRSVDLTASTKTASRSDLLPGESVAYTVTLVNQGLAVAQQISLSDRLPAGLTYAPGSLVCSSGVCNENGGLITWQGGLPPGDSLSLTYSATLNTVLPDRTPLTNSAEIRSAGVADLRRSATVYARSTNLSASVFDFGGRPNEPGDRFTLSALLRNTGIQSTDADFSLLLPAELSYLPGTLGCGVGNCRTEAGRILWSGTLPPRGLVAVQMDVQLSQSVVSGQRIRVQGEMVDHTFGLTHPVTGEMRVALHMMIPLLEGLGIEPPIFLPLLEHRPIFEEAPAAPAPTTTPAVPGSPLTTPSPTPTPAGR
ncbi:MAG: S8 family serine peptidase [Chloroflexi bacterium]|nr:S8 family serine peptidase [Chloroflexota bacterium]